MRDFRFTDDQRAFQTAVRDFLVSECTPADVRAVARHGTADGDRWAALAALGVVGLTVPEEHGGLGLGFLDLVLLLEEAGYAALPEPLLEVTAVTVPLVAEATGDVAARLLRAIAGGEQRVVAAVEDLQAEAGVDGTPLAWVGGDLVLPRSTTVQGQRSFDAARAPHRVTQATGGHTLLAGAAATSARDRARTRGAAGAAAQLVGATARMIDMAAAYAQQREQFGVPIGSFQAVKHHLSDCLVELEFARPAVYRAAWSITHGHADASVHAAMAKVLATEAAEHTAKAALQVHGAIGYTHEHDLHLWMRRCWTLAASYGSIDEHRAHLRAHLLG